MLDYHQYEKYVYDWLLSKHKTKNTFKFSTRVKASKGSELDYFIGTKKSQYFGTTFWSIPVGFPGSSGDCIDIIFKYSSKGYKYYIEFNQTKSPQDAQNTSALNLIKSLRNPIAEAIGLSYESNTENKMFTFISKPGESEYTSIDEMLNDVENDLITLFPILDEYIEKEKSKNPDFIANRFSDVQFEDMKKRMLNRFKKYAQIKTISSEKLPISEATKEDGFNFDVNIILYGPPGTGKTFNTVNYALGIIEGKDPDDFITPDSHTRKSYVARFNELKKLGQIEFVTFHQNYAYEDFIEGIKPGLNGKELSFERKDGIFKIIADRARKNFIAAKKDEPKALTFDEIFSKRFAELNDGIKEEVEIKMKQASFFITEISEKSIHFRKNKGESKHTLSIDTLNKMFDEESNSIILGGLQPYYNPLLTDLLEFKNKQKVNPTDKVNLKKYVLVIDEINRANISRVFGELITLIEKDKRLDEENEIRSTLPSGEEFVIPPNLYIIGTMNTADKSIALLDIALRRRFSFKPFYPDESLINNPKLKEIFITLNDYILKDKGADFTIGHSYFMDKSESDLADIMNDAVIPLLSEYYMNDLGEVQEVLKQAGILVSNGKGYLTYDEGEE
ncbi:MAG: McrB family protein [Salinivirgaceae bacterium]